MLPIQVKGVVTKYKGNGRKFHYPTANISTRIELKDGVYFGFANLANFQHHPALIFIGIPVTVGDTTRRIEAHLLDIPDKDYYDMELGLSVRYFHRDNKSFDSIDELLVVMEDDEKFGRQWFKELNLHKSSR